MPACAPFNSFLGDFGADKGSGKSVSRGKFFFLKQDLFFSQKKETSFF